MEKREIGRQEGSRGGGVGKNAGPHEVKTSSREGSGALHRVERPSSVRCGRGVVSVIDPTVLRSGVNTNVNRSNIKSGVVRQIPTS